MRIALVGAGGWGKNHARVLSQMGVLCGICDSDAERGSEFARTYSVPYHSSLNDMIGKNEFDGAVVATPTTTHFEIARSLITAGKHVFVEKPITYRSDDGQKLIDLAEKAGTVLTCGYIERFNPVVNMVKSRLDEKRYGDLIMLEFHRENRMPPSIRDTGIIHDTAVHDIDTANWLFSEMPNVVFARAGSIKHEYEDVASIMLGYKNQRTAIISANWVTPKKVRTFSAVCTDAIITSDFISQEARIEMKHETVIPSNPGQEPLLLELQGFADAAAGRSKPVVSPQQAVNVTRIAEAALLSSRRGVPIYLELK